MTTAPVTMRSGGANSAGALAAGSGSSIALSTGFSITSNGYGAHAEDAGQIGLAGGSITSVISALNLLSGGTVDATNVIMRATGGNAGGVYAQTGTANLRGGSVTTTTGSQSNGLLTRNAASLISADGVTLDTSGDGINAVFGSHVTFINGKITSRGDGVSVGAGALVELSASTVVLLGTGTQNAALRASDDGSAISADGLSITATGANAYGAWAQTGGRIDIDPTTIITSGNGAHGLLAEDASSIITSSGDSIYTGVRTNAAGVPIRANGAVATGPAQYVSSGATGAHGAFALGGAQIWLNTDPANGTATGGSGLIRTLGTESDGVRSEGTDSQVTVMSETIQIDGANSNGAHALSGGAIDGNALTINLNAANITGARAESGGTIDLVGSAIGTTSLTVALANGQIGLVASGNGSTIGITNGTVAIGPQTGTAVVSDLLAVRAEAGGAIALTNTAVSTRGGATSTANNGLLATGTGSTITLVGGSISTQSRNSTVLRAENGGVISFDGSAMTTIVTGIGQRGLLVSGTGSEIVGTGGSVTMGIGTVNASDMVAAHALGGGTISLTGTAILVQGGTNGFSNIGLLAAGSGSQISFSGGSVTTASRGSFGARAENGAMISLNNGATIVTAGGPTLSTTTPPDTGSHGLSATGAGSRIEGIGISVSTRGISAGAARAEDGATVSLADSTLRTTGTTAHALFATGPGSAIAGSAVTVTTTGGLSNAARAEAGATLSLTNGSSLITTAAHGLISIGPASRIEGSGTTISAGGTNINGARAEDGATVMLTGGAIATTGGGGSETLNAAAVDARTGGIVQLSGLAITTVGPRGDGMHADGAGSRIDATNVTVSTTWTQANAAANAVDVQNGATIAVANSSLTSLVTPVAVGFAGNSVGSTFTATNTNIAATGPTASGVAVITGSSASLTGGTVSTAGINSVALAAGNGTISATGVAITTTGVGRSYGALSAGNSLVTLTGSSIVTTGEPENPGTSNARRAEGMTAYNPGGILNSTGTSVTTSGVEAFGVVADDGGIITLRGNAVTTSGIGAAGLYAGIDQAGTQFLVDIHGADLTVRTAGARAYGGYVSRDFFVGTATMDLTGGSIATTGTGAVGLRAIGGGDLRVNRVDVATQGAAAHGLVSRYFFGAVAIDPLNQPTLAALDHAAITTRGAGAHGAVVQNGARITGSANVTANGSDAMALFAVGEIIATSGQAGDRSIANFTDSRLINASGPTIGIAGIADVSLTRTVVGSPLDADGTGGNAQWLLVGTTGDFAPLVSDPPLRGDAEFDMSASAPTAFTQTLGPLLARPGVANISVRTSALTGSAITRPGSIANLLMQDSRWDMTGSSNLTTLRNDLSEILFTRPAVGADMRVLASYKTLSVLNYVGAGGLIGLNTLVERDGAPSDRLIIDGGSAIGASRLRIANTEGLGAVTTGNGILVVSAVNGCHHAPRKLRAGEFRDRGTLRIFALSWQRRCERARQLVPAQQVFLPHTNANPDTDANANANPHAHTDADADADADPNAYSDPDPDPDPDPDSNANANANAHSDTHANSNSNAHPRADTDTKRSAARDPARDFGLFGRARDHGGARKGDVRNAA